MRSETYLSFSSSRTSNERSQATVTVCPSYVQSVYTHLLKAQQSVVTTQGFIKGSTPLTYVEYTFKNTIIEHLQEFFFTHCVINFLYSKMAEHKIEAAGEPVLIDVELDPGTGGRYTFEFIQVIPPIKHDWKRLTFKAPTRKNYKDLDRQVEHFLEEEQERATKDAKEEIVAGDWIFFSMTLVDEDRNKLLPEHVDYAWIKLGDEIIDKEAYEVFSSKRVGDSFYSSNELFQEYVNNNFTIKYTFLIEIKERVPYTFFSLEQFKKQFRLKTSRETHTKLIEVFSYRNDISQRRETVEALLKTLLSRYPFSAPMVLSERQENLVLKAIQMNPDYHVYKAQPDFHYKIKLLAEKQVKEHILINHLAYDEHMQATDEDVITYLNLTKRPRTKEFIYFDIPTFKAKGYEAPVPGELIRHRCLHEKMLNYVIGYLTKRA